MSGHGDDAYVLIELPYRGNYKVNLYDKEQSPIGDSPPVERLMLTAEAITHRGAVRKGQRMLREWREQRAHQANLPTWRIDA